MPDYMDGIQAGRHILFGVAAISAATGPANFLNTTGHHVLYLSVQAAGIMLNVVLSIGAVLVGLGISGLAAASALSLAIYAVTLAGATLSFTRSKTASRADLDSR